MTTKSDAAQRLKRDLLKNSSAVCSSDLVYAWKRYTELFGERPHGTLKQMAALLELIP